MKLIDLITCYNTTHLNENDPNDPNMNIDWKYKPYEKPEEEEQIIAWDTVQTNMYIDGLKSLDGNKDLPRAIAANKALMKYIKDYDGEGGHIKFPSGWKVHVLKPHPIYPRGSMDIHLVWKKILLVFMVDYEDRTIMLIDIGTHARVKV